jgi:hypothetical protein
VYGPPPKKSGWRRPGKGKQRKASEARAIGQVTKRLAKVLPFKKPMGLGFLNEYFERGNNLILKSPYRIVF